jgi:hypothetical protein
VIASERNLAGQYVLEHRSDLAMPVRPVSAYKNSGNRKQGSSRNDNGMNP